MNHRVWKSLLLIAVIGIGWSLAAGDTKPPQKIGNAQQAALMRAKLASTQKIVEGLVSKDFEAIRDGADEIRKICIATEWASHADQIYAHHRKELMRQAEKIIDAARDEHLDGTTYSYIHAMTTCISCHEYCRDVLKIANVETRKKVIPIPTTDDEQQPRTRQAGQR